MGDEAEGVFEKVHPWGFIRYGLDRPPLKVGALSLKLRYTPDYLTGSSLIEVIGCGRDGVIKLKCEKLTALQMWELDHPVQIFFWDSHNEKYAYAPLGDVVRAIYTTSNVQRFNDGKPYWALKVEDLEVEWTPRGKS